MTMIATGVEVSPQDLRAVAFERISRRLEWPIAILALAIVPALIVEGVATNPRWLALATAVNWVVWLAFCGEYLARLVLAPNRLAFVRSAWFDLAIIVLSPPFLVPESMQSVRAARALRLLRLLRALAVAAIGLRHLRQALRHHQFHWVAAMAVLMILLGATAEYYVERSAGGVRTFGDSLWWAIVTATTVGYGDVSPVTTAGRAIAVVLMLVGIGVIGAFTATIASWFIEEERSETPPDYARLERRLDEIDAKLDRLLRQNDRPGY